MPILESAEAALNVITGNDITFLKTLKAPTEVIKATLRAVVLIFDPKPPEKKKEGLTSVTDW
jgi:hypothetical protein